MGLEIRIDQSDSIQWQIGILVSCQRCIHRTPAFSPLRAILRFRGRMSWACLHTHTCALSFVYRSPLQAGAGRRPSRSKTVLPVSFCHGRLFHVSFRFSGCLDFFSLHSFACALPPSFPRDDSMKWSASTMNSAFEEIRTLGGPETR